MVTASASPRTRISSGSSIATRSSTPSRRIGTDSLMGSTWATAAGTLADGPPHAADRHPRPWPGAPAARAARPRHHRAAAVALVRRHARVHGGVRLRDRLAERAARAHRTVHVLPGDHELL